MHLVLWRQVWSVAAVQAAIALMWLTYRLYIPGLFAQFDLPLQVVVIFFMVEDLLAIAIEPLAGEYSDRLKAKVGTRFPLINSAIIAATSIFVLVPVVAVFAQPSDFGRSLLLGITLLWAIAMAMFRAPVLALLGNYASTLALPHAASLLTLITGLVGAVKLFASPQILSLGAPVAFVLAAIALLMAAIFLKIMGSRLEITGKLLPVMPTNYAGFPWLFGFGMAMSAGFRLVMAEILPRVWQSKLAFSSADLPMAGISLFLGLSGLVLGKLLATSWHKAGLLAAAVLAIPSLFSLIFLPGLLSTLLAMAILIICLSILLNGTFSLALELAPARPGLAIGIYSSGFVASNGLWNFYIPKSAQVFDLWSAINWGAIAFLGISLALLWRNKLPTSSSAS